MIFLKTFSKFQFSFSKKHLLSYSALSELQNQNPLIKSKLQELNIKLDSESPYNESEKAMLLLMNLGCWNCEIGKKEYSQEVFEKLCGFLEDYQQENMPFYQYLWPQVRFRQAMFLEEKMKMQECLEKFEEIQQNIEEFLENSETIIEENLHLLVKVCEKIGNLYKKKGDFEKMVEYFKKALLICNKTYTKSNIFRVKLNCFIGDFYKKQNLEECIQYLEFVIDNIEIKSKQEGSLFSISSNQLVQFLFERKQYSKLELVFEKIELKIQNQFIPLLQNAIFLNFKAEYFQSQGQNKIAFEIFESALSIGMQIFPKNHQFVQNIFEKMKILEKII